MAHPTPPDDVSQQRAPRGDGVEPSAIAVAICAAANEVKRAIAVQRREHSHERGRIAECVASVQKPEVRPMGHGETLVEGIGDGARWPLEVHEWPVRGKGLENWPTECGSTVDHHMLPLEGRRGRAERPE